MKENTKQHHLTRGGLGKADKIKKFIRDFIYEKGINFNADKKDEQYIICDRISNYVADVYIIHHTLHRASEILNVNSNYFRHFLKKADSLGFIDYRDSRKKSKQKVYGSDSLTKMECRKAVSLFENGFPMREISEICNVPQKEIESFLKKHYQLQRYFASSTHRQDEEHESARASSKSDIVEKINRAKDLYETHYSICKVAEIMNITRERVRQLLVEGERLGLCRDIPIKDRKIKLLRRYSKKDIIASIQRNITQEKVCRELRITPQSSFFLMSQYGIVWKMINKGRLIASIQRNYSKKKVCKELRIVPQSLNYLINFYGIDWRLIQGGIRKGKCLGKYYRIVKKLKRHPHSDELIGKPGSLYSSIIRNWGSLAAFRKINKIKKPPPRYNHCRPILRKVKKINRVKDIVLKHGLVDMSTIARISKIKQQSLYQYLTLLRKLGFIGFTGSRQKRKYKIIKKNDVSLGELFPQ